MKYIKYLTIALIFSDLLMGCQSDAEKARDLLNKAHVLIRENHGAQAKKLLSEIVGKYPSTIEATEANKLLNTFQIAGALNKPKVAQIAITQIEGQLALYMHDIGSYPDQGAGLHALLQNPGNAPNWNGPYLKKDPKDPWGKPFIYRLPGRHGLDYDLCSAGADSVEGTEDDICNQM